MKNFLFPTDYADVNIVVQEFLKNILSILDDQFVGLYLYGSLALGDFDPHNSDIDFIVLTRKELPDDRFAALREMHIYFDQSDSPWARKIEAAYIPLDALNHPSSDSAKYPQIERGTELARAPFEVGWAFQRHILREYGVTVSGPSPRSLIDPVNPAEMRHTAAVILSGWQDQSCNDPSWIAWARERNSLVFIVLTLCRIRYSIETESVASKPAAAHWAQGNIEPRWNSLIELALTSPHDTQEISDSDLNEMLAFLNDTMERLQSLENRSSEP